MTLVCAQCTRPIPASFLVLLRKHGKAEPPRLCGRCTLTALRRAIEAMDDEPGCGHLAHLDPRAGHLGRCPDCGEVLDPVLGAPQAPTTSTTSIAASPASETPEPEEPFDVCPVCATVHYRVLTEPYEPLKHCSTCMRAAHIAKLKAAASAADRSEYRYGPEEIEAEGRRIPDFEE